MNSERSRILDMLARGVISVKECEEMLAAVEKRIDEKVKNDIEEAKKSGTARPLAVVLLIILALVALQALVFIAFPAFNFFFFGRRMGFDIRFLPRFIPLLFLAGIVLASTGFWIWMLIDCITRRPDRFRLYFSLKHDTDKLVWLALIVLLNLVGAFAYFILIFLPKRTVSKAQTVEAEPYEPPPPARLLNGFAWCAIVLTLLPTIFWIVFMVFEFSEVSLVEAFKLNINAFSASTFLVIFWMLVFWLKMLIDCVRRDRRDFGAFTQNQSADKVVWLALIMVTFVFGGLSYHMVIRRNPAAGIAKFRRAFLIAFLAHIVIIAILIPAGYLFHIYMESFIATIMELGIRLPSRFIVFDLVVLKQVGYVAILSGAFIGALGLLQFIVSRFTCPKPDAEGRAAAE